MSGDLVERLRAGVGGPRDGALLRFSLGNALLAAGDPRAAIEALRAALEFDPRYSAAWKSLGKALEQDGDREGAIRAYSDGIRVAGERGDKQAQKEMQVFLRRLDKAGG